MRTKKAKKPAPKPTTPPRAARNRAARKLEDAVNAASRLKPRTLTRSSISGAYGSGEKEARKLAKRIMRMRFDIDTSNDEIERRVAAELLAATTVREAGAEPIGAGWVLFDDDDETGFWGIYKRQPKHGHSEYVRLIPATPPPASRRRVEPAKRRRK